MTTAVWWIRRDLRLTDNPALTKAVNHYEWVIPLFIIDPVLMRSDYVGPRRVSFLLQGLAALEAQLLELGSRLILRTGSPEQVIFELQQENHFDVIVAQADYSSYARRRDHQIGSIFPLQLLGSPCIRPPESILKGNGEPYQVFTPYSRRWFREGDRVQISDPPARISTPAAIKSEAIPETPSRGNSIFPAGEAAAQVRLEQFTSGPDAPIYRYDKDRNFLDREGTSSLSPYLRFGMISPRYCFNKASYLQSRAEQQDPSAGKGIHAWVNELAWRDFYQSILYHYPHVLTSNFREPWDNFPWINDETSLTSWKKGLTGYPVVDAAMRQLNEIGWMHNRARMVTASFLTKDLLIHWRFGEQWFMNQLVDGDPASNNGGWQWAAGTGADAAPYYRIFNPVVQSKKFDPSGRYIRRWVPELEQVPLNYIHRPWEMPQDLQESYRCRIGLDYPHPIVDHQQARQRALDLFKNYKKS